MPILPRSISPNTSYLPSLSGKLILFQVSIFNINLDSITSTDFFVKNHARTLGDTTANAAFWTDKRQLYVRGLSLHIIDAKLDLKSKSLLTIMNPA